MKNVKVQRKKYKRIYLLTFILLILIFYINKNYITAYEELSNFKIFTEQEMMEISGGCIECGWCSCCTRESEGCIDKMECIKFTEVDPSTCCDTFGCEYTVNCHKKVYQYWWCWQEDLLGTVVYRGNSDFCCR